MIYPQRYLQQKYTCSLSVCCLPPSLTVCVHVLAKGSSLSISSSSANAPPAPCLRLTLGLFIINADTQPQHRTAHHRTAPHKTTDGRKDERTNERTAIWSITVVQQSTGEDWVGGTRKMFSFTYCTETQHPPGDQEKTLKTPTEPPLPPPSTRQR